MVIIQTKNGDEYWDKTVIYAENCAWGEVGSHLAGRMKSNGFIDWEAVFIAVDSMSIVGFCTFLKEDFYPENRYSPWISTIFVDESRRGKRLSHQMIETAVKHAKKCGFSKVYIPSDMTGFYEKAGFHMIDTLKNYNGDMDRIFMREI